MGILDDYMSLDDFAAQVGKSPRSVRRWANSTANGLPIHRLGRTPLIHVDDAKAWLAGRRVQRNVRRGSGR